MSAAGREEMVAGTGHGWQSGVVVLDRLTRISLRVGLRVLGGLAALVGSCVGLPISNCPSATQDITSSVRPDAIGRRRGLFGQHVEVQK